MTNKEIDELVAEKIMGWNPNRKRKDWGDVNFQDYTEPKNYSTDISPAMEIAEKFAYYTIDKFKDKTFDCRLVTKEHFSFEVFRIKSLPMAICLAALKSAGIEIE